MLCNKLRITYPFFVCSVVEHLLQSTQRFEAELSQIREIHSLLLRQVDDDGRLSMVGGHAVRHDVPVGISVVVDAFRDAEDIFRLAAGRRRPTEDDHPEGSVHRGTGSATGKKPSRSPTFSTETDAPLRRSRTKRPYGISSTCFV